MELREYCWPIEKFSLFRRHYAIIDTKEYLADDLFIKHQVNVQFGDEYGQADSPYVFIFCSVRKGDEQKFLKAMEELPNKMLLCGYLDYSAYCEKMRKFVDHEMKGERIDETDGPAEEAEQTCPERISCPPAWLVERPEPGHESCAEWQGV